MKKSLALAVSLVIGSTNAAFMANGDVIEHLDGSFTLSTGGGAVSDSNIFDRQLSFVRTLLPRSSAKHR